MAEELKKIIFLDRDGVINKKAEDHEYIARAEDFVINDGLFELLRPWHDAGYEIIVITNQRGVARGKISDANLAEIHSKMLEIFSANNLNLLDIFYCPHEEDACDCRKPRPGLLRLAADKYRIDLEQAVLISDSSADIEMGRNFGVGKNILVRTDTLEVIE